MIQFNYSLVSALPRQYRRFETKEFLFWNIMETRVCNKCHQELPITNFSHKKNGYQPTCKSCSNKYCKTHRIENLQQYKDRDKRRYDTYRAEIIENKKEYYKSHKSLRDKYIRERLEKYPEKRFGSILRCMREAFIAMYGDKCACCGETEIEFLTFEHKMGQRGKKRETQYAAYKNALNEYRPDLYEVLCMNCNHAKGKLGYCPHHPNQTCDQRILVNLP